MPHMRFAVANLVNEGYYSIALPELQWVFMLNHWHAVYAEIYGSGDFVRRWRTRMEKWGMDGRERGRRKSGCPSGCQKTHGELERAEALSIFNRARRRVRRARDDFCGGKSRFPEQKSLPCSFCARKSERFQQKLVGVAGRLKTQGVFRFCLWQNCHGSNRRFEARHLAGELAPLPTSLSK